MPSSGMWRRVDPVKWTDVSEELIVSIFRVEKSASDEPAWAGGSIFLYPEDGGDTFLRNVGSFHRIYMAPISLPWRWRRYAPPKRRFIYRIYMAPIFLP
jgi:hypothetical protein